MGNLSSVDTRSLATLSQYNGDKGQHVLTLEKAGGEFESNLNSDYFLQLIVACFCAILKKIVIFVMFILTYTVPSSIRLKKKTLNRLIALETESKINNECFIEAIF